MYDEESKSRYFGTIQADQIAALSKQIEELRQRVSELEDRMRLMNVRGATYYGHSSEERYYSSLGEDE